MRGLYGDAGTAWTERLPELFREVCGRWSLTLEEPFQNLFYNYVSRARRADGADVVVKVGYPCRELMTEIEALRLFNGRGAVRLLEADKNRGALLLERLRPGSSLLNVECDEEATAIAAAVMRSLWHPAPNEHSFPTAADWGRGFERLRTEFGGGTGPFPTSLVEQAEGQFRDLLASAGPPVLLHGDLHYGNILAAEREPWLAIDPKGLIAEPAYEVGALIRNRLNAGPDLARLFARRLDQLSAELSLDRERLRGWTMAQAVLSAWWTYEDHGEVALEALRVAEALLA